MEERIYEGDAQLESPGRVESQTNLKEDVATLKEKKVRMEEVQDMLAKEKKLAAIRLSKVKDVLGDLKGQKGIVKWKGQTSKKKTRQSKKARADIQEESQEPKKEVEEETTKREPQRLKPKLVIKDPEPHKVQSPTQETLVDGQPIVENPATKEEKIDKLETGEDKEVVHGEKPFDEGFKADDLPIGGKKIENVFNTFSTTSPQNFFDYNVFMNRAAKSHQQP